MISAIPEVIAIVPAAGTGSRMQNHCRKQYLTIAGKTLLEHAVYRLLRHNAIRRVIIALHAEDNIFPHLALAQHPQVHTVTGGSQRADSVLAGLQAAGEAQWALVHDAARPCLHHDDLKKLLAVTQYSQYGAILATPVRDTMKRATIAPGIHHHPVIDATVDRTALWHALTPQLFPLALLRQCLSFALAQGVIITDEASALEYCGLHPVLVHGRADNIKVTRPEDLALAEFYLSRLFPDGD